MSSIRSRKHTVSPYAAALTALALPLLAAPLIGHAADTADTDTYKREHGEEILIKGERHAPYKEEKSSSKKATAELLDTPQTVQVIGKEIIKEQGATTLTEALRNSPGVGTFYLGENGSTSTGDAIYMRGTDSSGSIFVDGVRDVAAISRDVFNIESVEVLKGAAGADIGRGSATGAINIYSKHAALHNFYNASVSAGGGDFARATADLNWRLGETSALRLNLMDQDAGVAGRDVVKNKRWGVATSLAYGLGTSTRYFLDYMHVDQDNIPDGGVLTIGLPGYSSPDPTNRAYLTNAARVDSSNFYGTKSDFENVQSDVLTFSVEHDFNNGLRLSNITRWSETSQQYQLTSFMAGSTQLVTPDADDPSTWTVTRNMNNRDAVNKMLTNQTNLQVKFSTGGLQHSLSTGIELISEEAESYTLAATGGAIETVSVYNPVYTTTVYTRARNGVYTDVKADTIGIYANDTIQLSKAWQLTAGLRLDHYKIDSYSMPATFIPVELKAEDDIVSGKLGLVYKPAKNGSIYASYAVTKTPPGGASLAPLVTTTNANNADTPPQESKTAEIGTKWDILNNRLSLTGAVYNTQYSDTVAQDTDGSYYRTGEKTVSGIELGAVGQINPQWNISAGYTIMNTKVKNQTLVAADGSTNLTYNPSDSLTVWTTWSPNKRFSIGGGPRYNGEMKRGTDGAVGTPSLVKSYVVFDGLASYQVNRRLQLQLNVYNLFDKEYVAAINKSGYRYTPGTPQTFRLTANVNF
ncbi:MAG: catecholate siderophore receptor Fiu [Asticcacaulis sp.]|uniref:catecholate siderophore receptor Fiu n=1 Tax=Asticcacaulis sp. TaxID=1872648 RepID=UPI0039E63D4B